MAFLLPTKTSPAMADRTTARPRGDTPGPLVLGRMGRAGAWLIAHGRLVAIIWTVLVVGLGAFAPRVEHALAGAGWEASGSDSVAARAVVQREFAGMSSAALQVVVHVDHGSVSGPAGRRAVDRAVALLRAEPRVSDVLPPQPGVSVSRDGRTAVIRAGAADPDTN